MKRILSSLLLVSILVGGFLFAQSTDTKEHEAAKTARIKATNVVELRNLVGKTATVYGKIASTGMASSGHHFLNFYGKQVSVFCHKNDVAKFKDGKPATQIKGKDVEISGELSLYKDKLQLKLIGPEQIKIIDLSTANATTTQPIELKEVAKNTWVSPAGLRFAGRDPEGLTRVEHIMRHVRDIPDRDGPHGVFDGSKRAAFAVIDEAWMLAERKKLRATREGDRSSYLVSMNRRVGYLGGSTGKRKGHPALTRVFIVFETNTKNIITAFPR